jgi:GntR family transcriptional regulator/MocR family aminotransferase
MDYGNAIGLQSLRNGIAIYLRTAQGVRGEAEQIMVAKGSQQAFDICARALLDPGCRPWMEAPG